MASSAQDDAAGGQIPRNEPDGLEGHDSQGMLHFLQEETQQPVSVSARPIQVSSGEMNVEPAVYIPVGGGVSRYDDVKYLEEKISKVEECLEKERSDYNEQIEGIKKELVEVEQKLYTTKCQLLQATTDKSILLSTMTAHLRLKDTELCAKDDQLKAKGAELRAKEEEVKAKEALLYVKDAQVRSKEADLHEKDTVMKTKDAMLHAKDEQMKAKDAALCAKDEQIKAKDIELAAKDERIMAKDAELCAKDERIKAKDTELSAKDDQLKSKDEQMKGKDVELRTKDEQLRLKDVQLSEKEEEMRSHASQLRGLIERLEARHSELIEQLKAKNSNANNHTEELQKQKSQLVEELESKKRTILKLENERQSISSTNNTGANNNMPQNEPINILNGAPSENDSAKIVLARPCITFWKDKELGRGAFATVYKGELNNEQCAVKVLNQVAMHLISELPAGPCDGPIVRKGVESFTTECSCLMALDHPNIVKLIDVCTYDKGSFPVLIMEKLDCSLTTYLRRPNQTMDHLVVLSLCRDVASALEYLHKHRIIHRDICGNNVLLALSEQTIIRAKVSDFGMSRILKDFEGMSTTLTTIEGHRAAYYPPELQDEAGSSDSSIDIFMFGVLMLQITHGLPCVTSRKQRKELIQNLSDRHILKSAIVWCTEFEKNKRPGASDIFGKIEDLYGEQKQKMERKKN